MRRLVPTAALLLALLAGCGGGERLNTSLPKAPSDVQVTSPAFASGEVIPRRFTCDGAGSSPPLRWSGVPAAAAELALIVSDPDAPGGRFVHWTLYALPPQLAALPAGLPELGGARQGRNSFGKAGWGAPCPPKGSDPHRYEFDLYWLEEPIAVAAGAEPEDVLKAVAEGAGGRGRLVGRYARKG